VSHFTVVDDGVSLWCGGWVFLPNFDSFVALSRNQPRWWLIKHYSKNCTFTLQTTRL